MVPFFYYVLCFWDENFSLWVENFSLWGENFSLWLEFFRLWTETFFYRYGLRIFFNSGQRDFFSVALLRCAEEREAIDTMKYRWCYQCLDWLLYWGVHRACIVSVLMSENIFRVQKIGGLRALWGNWMINQVK